MVTARALAWLALPGVVACANVWGFADLTKGSDGAGPVDATAGSREGEATADGTTADGSPRDTSIAQDGDAGQPVAADASSEDAEIDATDGARDSAPDAAAEADAGPPGDGGVEAGCGPTNNILNCSACGIACDNRQSLGAACNGTTCTYGSCAAGFGDCDMQAPNSNGCETALNTVTDCSACGRACDTTHSVGASCNGASCVYTSCKPGWADCDTTPPDTNGCETQISSGPACGACGQSCDTSGHSLNPSCDAGAGSCVYSGCASGWADCNTTPPDTNGCETSLSLVTSCGACGQACSTTTGTPSCDGQRCSYTCKQGHADCDKTGANTDGCECQTPGCCGMGCQTIHSTGIAAPTVYYDCNALGHSQTQAMNACAAFTGNASACAASQSGGCNCLTLLCGPPASSVCGAAGTQCYCWQYGGPNPGTVQATNASNCSATCGVPTDPSWD